MLDAADVKSSLGYCFLVTYVKKREKKINTSYYGRPSSSGLFESVAM